MVLAIEELSALEDEIMSVLPDKITAILSKLNRKEDCKNFSNCLVWKIYWNRSRTFTPTRKVKS